MPREPIPGRGTGTASRCGPRVRRSLVGTGPALTPAGAGGTTPRAPVRRWLARIRQVVQRAAPSGQPPPGSHYNSRSSGGPPPSSGGTSEPREPRVAAEVSSGAAGRGRRCDRGSPGAPGSPRRRPRRRPRGPRRSTAPSTTATASSSAITTSSRSPITRTSSPGVRRQALRLEVVEGGQDQPAHLVVGEPRLHLLGQGVADLLQRPRPCRRSPTSSRGRAGTPPTPRTPPRSRTRARRQCQEHPPTSGEVRGARGPRAPPRRGEPRP